ncbi:tape measure protein [Pantoea sp. Acro-805]|uniref:Tape measure protein n=1 Tax=Candidatus Pantoea formicae TaxID=2608355 RepID=A0ABX0QNX3_9GAMM|nr:tape measure protein [Pantoea formicae]NIE98459.1 tape measure protein [Pantoea formicae]
MSEKVGDIYYEVGADIAPLLQGSTQANAALDAIGKGASKASGNLDNLERSAQKTSKAVVRSADDASNASKMMEALGNEVAILEEKQQKGARAAVILAAELRAGASATQAQRKEIGQLAGELFDLKQAQDQANAAQQKSNGIMAGVKTGLTAIASAIAISQLVQYGKQFLEVADTMTQLQARIDRLSSSAKESATTFQALSDIASASGSSLKDTEKLWETLTSSLKNAGASNAQILTLTDTLQKIGRIGGSSTEEMANALHQLGQSIAGGTVRAEEFNSIIEQMPELARQMAAGLGISVGELRKRMLEGKLSAEDALNAIMTQTGLMNQEFSKLPRTVDQATNSLTISFQELVKQINDTTGTSTGMVHFIDSITAAIDRLAGRVPNATQQISDLNSTADMFARRARTYSFLGLDGWAAQAEGINAVSNKAAALVGDLAAISKANASASNQPIKIAGAGAADELSKLEKSTKRKLELSRFEGEARARLQAQYDAEDAGITDSKRIKALQDEYAATERNTSARKSSAAEGKKASSQAESDAQKLEVLRQKSDQVADSTKELSRSQAILQAQQSLSKSATDAQILQAGEYAAKIWDQNNALKQQAQIKQGQNFANQEVAAGKASVNPLTGEAVDPVAQIDQQEQKKLAALANYQAIDLQNAQLYEDAKTSIQQQAANAREQIAITERQTYQQNMSNLLGATSDSVGAVADAIGQAAGKSSAAYQAMFAISKGFAVAQAALNLQTAIGNAMALPYPANIPAIAQAVAAGGQMVSAISSISYGGGREKGGPVDGNSIYRVGEGGKPEIFKASNGNQYMIPGDNGSVISNKDIGGSSGGGGVIEQHNYFTITSATGDPEELTKQIAQISYQQSLRAMKDQQRPGGMLTQRK